MAIPQFDSLITILKSVDRDAFTIQYLYKSYIYGLLVKGVKNAPVNELLFQLQIISAYVEHTLKQTENQNTNLITMKAVPDDIKNNIMNHSDINHTLSHFFKDIDTVAYKAVAHSSADFFKLLAIVPVVVFGVISAVLIGAAFAPELATAAAITLWTIGAVFSALTLASAIIRFTTDTSKPEISLGKNNDVFAGHPEYLDLKRNTLKDVYYPSGVNNYNKYFQKSPCIATAETLENIISQNKAIMTSMAAICSTIYIATETRYAPMYQHQRAPKLLRPENVQPDQQVNLSALYKMV